jgi:hypothetical protein
MRLYELECSHGIGHSSGVHGCDGCCAMLTKPATEAERERITKLLVAKAIQSRLKLDRDEADYLDLLIGIINGGQK